MTEWLLIWIVVSGFPSEPVTGLPDNQRFEAQEACLRAAEVIEEDLDGGGYDMRASCIEVPVETAVDTDD